MVKMLNLLIFRSSLSEELRRKEKTIAERTLEEKLYKGKEGSLKKESEKES